MPPAVSEAQAEALLAAAAPFRDAYLSAALARLNEAVGAAFPGGSRPLPTAVDLQKCIGCDATQHTCCATCCVPLTQDCVHCTDGEMAEQLQAGKQFAITA